jgi:hypothetical protein
MAKRAHDGREMPFRWKPRSECPPAGPPLVLEPQPDCPPVGEEPIDADAPAMDASASSSSKPPPRRVTVAVSSASDRKDKRNTVWRRSRSLLDALSEAAAGSEDAADQAAALKAALPKEVLAQLCGTGDESDVVAAPYALSACRQQPDASGRSCLCRAAREMGIDSLPEARSVMGVGISRAMWEASAAGEYIELDKGGRPEGSKHDSPDTIAAVKAILNRYSRETCMTRKPWKKEVRDLDPRLRIPIRALTTSKSRIYNREPEIRRLLGSSATYFVPR